MLTQTYREFAVSTVLGPDVLVLQAMTAVERISDLFEFDLDLLTARQTVDMDSLLGTNMTVRVSMDQGERHFNGFVAAISHVGVQGRFAQYQVTLRPWLWFLTRNRDSRIFQNRKVVDIVREVLRNHGFTDIKERLSSDYQPWEYCVQYQESDFDFISRLLEQEGIYYYFIHANGTHTLVLGDGIGAHDPLTPSPTLVYRANPLGRDRGQSVSGWSVTREVQGGVYALADFEFEKPRQPLRSASRKPARHAISGMELYEYPGGMAYAPLGQRAAMAERIARQRMEEVVSRHERLSGGTAARSLRLGCLFTLAEHPRQDQNQEYLVIAAVTELVSDQFEGTGGGGGMAYACRFDVIPSKTPFRPARRTPWPSMRGPQTAIVTGKAGEEIWTDSFGRIKVRFHWDRSGRDDDTSSCWVRVAQVWAGKRWGGLFLPRVGQEVVVDFLDGDPNRPLVTGRVYNGEAMPPFDMTRDATRSGFRSNSSKGGGGNEWWFDDKAGQERVYLHAQRDHDIRVRRQQVEFVGAARHAIVGGDRLQEVRADDHLTVAGDRNVKITGTLSQVVGEDWQQQTSGNAALDIGSALHVKAGASLVLEAGSQITIKVGGSFITVGPDGVTIKGPAVRINSGGSAGSGSGASPETAKKPRAALSPGPGQATTASAPPRRRATAAQLDSHPVAAQMRKAHDGAVPFCGPCEKPRPDAMR